MAKVSALHGLIHNADDAAAFLVAMAQSRRLLALCKLAKQEINVGTLAEELGISQSGVSVHLNTLKAQKLITGRREGTEIFYSVTSPRVERILIALAGIYLR